MTPARIACIMPFYNEAASLPLVLDSIERQTIDPSRLYVIGVDNASTDGGGRLFERWLRRSNTPGVLVREPRRSIARALNAGLRHASTTDIIVRLDAHALYGRDYLASIDAAFGGLPGDVWCVGGAPTPPAMADGYASQLAIALYSNPLGLGPADFRRNATAPRPATTVYLGAWRPGVLQRLGGFDERWLANEDCELTERIQAAGGRVFRIPLDVERMPTRSALGMVRQWTRYGFWRMQTFKWYPGAVRVRHVAPPAMLLFGAGLLALRQRRLLLTLYGLYACATIAGRRRGESMAVTAGTLIFFPMVQAGYALGLLTGVAYTPAQLRGGRRGCSQYRSSALPAQDEGESVGSTLQ